MKRVVGGAEPEARRLRGLVLRRPLHHRRRQRRRLRGDGGAAHAPQRRRGRRGDRARAWRCRAPPRPPDEPTATRSCPSARGLPPRRLRGSTRSRCARACRRSPWGENSEALFLTSSFVQPDAATAAARFANEEEAFIYSRFTNPTVTMMERRLAALEGTEACIATASGMSAILLLGMGLLKAGDHVICSQSVFGSTIELFGREFAKFGVETSFVSQTDVAAWRAAVQAEHASCCSPSRRPIR